LSDPALLPGRVQDRSGDFRAGLVRGPSGPPSVDRPHLARV